MIDLHTITDVIRDEITRQTSVGISIDLSKIAEAVLRVVNGADLEERLAREDPDRDKVLKSGLSFIQHHRCALCDEPVGYVVSVYGGEAHLYFDSNCSCSSAHSVPQPAAWADAAKALSLLPDT